MIDDSRLAVRIDGLRKVYVKRNWHCAIDQKGSVKAVQDVNLTIEKGELLCLLGHNGCGKSTTIGMLTGLFSATAGDAYIYGYSVHDEIADIRGIMGVCPQHDILWKELTGAEHIELFAAFKQLSLAEIPREVSTRMADVRLTADQHRVAGTYSGGMMRRLSVAIALTADPKIVYLDEPTTGMDPISRRQVWNLIQRVKKDRVILLTTHSMEEADVLGDKIAIMKAGRIRALGTPLGLKNKFGTGYNVTVMAPPGKLGSAKTFLLHYFKDLRKKLASKMKETVKSNSKKSTKKKASSGNSKDDVTLPESLVSIFEERPTYITFKCDTITTDYLYAFFTKLEKNVP